LQAHILFVSESLTLSVVVTITDGAPNVSRCLDALAVQQNAPAMEILVPVHPALDPVEELQRKHPSARFVPVDHLPFSEKPRDPGLRHLVYDYRRAAGLRAAQGEIIAMTEDHAIPPPDWCAKWVALHESLPYAAIGGAIDPACSTYLSWAAYFGEFIRYQNPVPEGPAAYLSDVNVAYKRKALEDVRAAWVDLYHETAVHGALRDAGETLWLHPGPVIRHDRGRLSFLAMCRERIAWAMLFAARRTQGTSLTRRLLLAAGTPLIPALFLARRFAIVIRTKRSFLPLIATSPILAVFFALWAWGEMLGYLTAKETGLDHPR
jgi:hypothetical protein